MLNLTLSEETVQVEREVIVEERRLRTDNHPEALLHEHAMAALFLNHRYGIPVIGWMHEIRSWTLDDVLAFYRRWYLPSNAILVVAGHVAWTTCRRSRNILGSAVPRRQEASARAGAHRSAACRHAGPRIKHSLWMRLYLPRLRHLGETPHPGGGGVR